MQLAVLIASLVEGHRADDERSRVVVGAHGSLSGREGLPESSHGRDVRRVDADQQAGGQSAVQLRLDGGNLRSSISPGSLEAEDTARRLDSLVGRGHEPRAGLEHQRGTLGVQVAVRVADVFERGPDVAERDGGGIGGVGGEENNGHGVCPFKTCEA